MAIFYVRPNQSGNYGSGDGSSYANAWNGLENVKWNLLSVPGVSSTLWVCGTHKRRMQVPTNEYGGAAYTSARRYDGLVIRGDYPGDPGVIDVREFTYTYVSSLSPDQGADLSRFVCGSPSYNQAYSVHLASARNVTPRHDTSWRPAVSPGR